MKRALILAGKLAGNVLTCFAVSAVVFSIFGYDWHTVIQNTITLSIIFSLMIIYHNQKSQQKHKDRALILAAKLFGMLLICFAVYALVDLFFKVGWRSVIINTLVLTIACWGVIIYYHVKKRD